MTLETVALVQFDPSLGPADDGTLTRICDRIEAIATERDPDLIVLPELATTGYSGFGQFDDWAEPIGGATTEALGAAAAAADAHLLVGMAVRDEAGIRNSAVWLDRDGRPRAQYNKRNLWGDERAAFVPGEDALVITCENLVLGIQICYDLNFPEMSAAFARAEIDALINISAWSVPMASDWNRLLSARAIENGAFVLGCNRTGDEHAVTFYGHSTVYAPDGSIAGRLNEQPDTLVQHLSEATLVRERDRNPMRRDRRTEATAVRRIEIKG